MSTNNFKSIINETVTYFTDIIMFYIAFNIYILLLHLHSWANEYVFKTIIGVVRCVNCLSGFQDFVPFTFIIFMNYRNKNIYIKYMIQKIF